MIAVPNIILGAQHADKRGVVRFFNEFNMTQIKRFYVIENSSLEIRRGWRGHKIEKRWFYATNGAFLIRLVKIDNWQLPNRSLRIEEFVLSSAKNEVLEIPEGYASCVQAIDLESRLIVFANYELEHAKNDDYLYDDDYFNN